MSKFEIGDRKLEGELRRGVLEIEKCLNNEVWLLHEEGKSLVEHEERITALADLRTFGFRPEDYELAYVEGCRALDMIKDQLKGQLIDATGIRLIDRAMTIRQMMERTAKLVGGLCICTE